MFIHISHVIYFPGFIFILIQLFPTPVYKQLKIIVFLFALRVGTGYNNIPNQGCPQKYKPGEGSKSKTTIKEFIYIFTKGNTN